MNQPHRRHCFAETDPDMSQDCTAYNNKILYSSKGNPHIQPRHPQGNLKRVLTHSAPRILTQTHEFHLDTDIPKHSIRCRSIGRFLVAAPFHKPKVRHHCYATPAHLNSRNHSPPQNPCMPAYWDSTLRPLYDKHLTAPRHTMLTRHTVLFSDTLRIFCTPGPHHNLLKQFPCNIQNYYFHTQGRAECYTLHNTHRSCNYLSGRPHLDKVYIHKRSSFHPRWAYWSHYNIRYRRNSCYRIDIPPTRHRRHKPQKSQQKICQKIPSFFQSFRRQLYHNTTPRASTKHRARGPFHTPTGTIKWENACIPKHVIKIFQIF